MAGKTIVHQGLADWTRGGNCFFCNFSPFMSILYLACHPWRPGWAGRWWDSAPFFVCSPGRTIADERHL